jgi:hypothetical protein
LGCRGSEEAELGRLRDCVNGTVLMGRCHKDFYRVLLGEFRIAEDQYA